MDTTVDGRNPAPAEMYNNPVNNGRNYQPQLVSQISSISSTNQLEVYSLGEFDHSSPSGIDLKKEPSISLEVKTYSHLKIHHSQKERSLVFQPSLFRGEWFNFRSDSWVDVIKILSRLGLDRPPEAGSLETHRYCKMAAWLVDPLGYIR